MPVSMPTTATMPPMRTSTSPMATPVLALRNFTVHHLGLAAAGRWALARSVRAIETAAIARVQAVRSVPTAEAGIVLGRDLPARATQAAARRVAAPAAAPGRGSSGAQGTPRRAHRIGDRSGSRGWDPE